jgi:hypothetical protein
MVMLNYHNYTNNALLIKEGFDVSTWQNVNKKLMKELNIDMSFIMKFGTSITALYPIIQTLVKDINAEVKIDASAIVLLTLCALFILFHESKDDIKKLKIMIEERKLNGFLSKIVEFLKLNFSVFKILCSKMGKTFSTLYDLLSYNVLYVPFMSALLEVITNNKLDLDNVFKYIVGTTIGLFMIYTKHFIEEITAKFNNKLKK